MQRNAMACGGVEGDGCKFVNAFRPVSLQYVTVCLPVCTCLSDLPCVPLFVCPFRRHAERDRRRAEARVELHPYIQLLLSRPPPPYIADPGWGDLQVGFEWRRGGGVSGCGCVLAYAGGGGGAGFLGCGEIGGGGGGGPL